MSFENIIGNKAAINILRNSIAVGRVASGYLFQGPEGVGKKLAAMNFAMALECEQGGTDPCGECTACHKIQKGFHPDVHILAPHGKARMIKVDHIQELIATMSLMAFEGRWKIFIIDDAECMNQESQNKLLKTLEEPPAQSVQILISSQPARLLPTILSRCQKVVFQALAQDDIELYLKENLDVDAVRARLLAALAHGQISRVHKLMDNEHFARRDKILGLLSRGKFAGFKQLQECTDEIEKELDVIADQEDRLELEEIDPEFYKSLSSSEKDELTQQRAASVASRYRAEVEEVLNLLVFWYRDLLLLKITGNERLVKNVDKIEELREFSAQYEIADLMDCLEQIQRIYQMIVRNMKLTFCLQVLFLRLGFLP